VPGEKCIVAVLLTLFSAALPNSTSTQESSAERLHRESVVVDGYIGTTSQIMWTEWTFVERHGTEASHVDLPRMVDGGMDAAFFSVGAHDSVTGPAAIEVSLEEIDRLHRLVDRHPDQMRFCRSADDVRRAHREGKVGVLLGMMGGHNIDESLAVLRVYRRLGVSYMHLNHDTNTSWSDASRDDPRHRGLTEFGKQVVDEMNRIGMIVDISHVSDASARAALDRSTAPVIASHSSAQALSSDVRNLSDDLIRAVAASGGVVMVNFNLPFLDEDYRRAFKALQPELSAFSESIRAKYPGLENIPRWREEGRRFLASRMPRVPWTRIVDHIDHIVDLVGAEHVGLGSDFDGALMPEGMDDCSKLPHITEELLRRGYSHEDIQKILGENILRVMEAVQTKGRRLRQQSADR
jgi:membrane dipeptidase